MGSTLSEKKRRDVVSEAELLRGLKHPCLISSYCYFFDQEQVLVKKKSEKDYKVQQRTVFCIVMEYAPKGDLL